MATRASSILTLLVLTSSVLSVPALAGGFRVTDVDYVVQPIEYNDDQITVIVLGTAQYKGKLDANDVDAIWDINTHLNTSLSGDLFNWEFPEWTGIGNIQKGVPYSGYVITCDEAHGAIGAVDKCDAQNKSVIYLGHGAAGIYHVRGPESDEGLGRTQDTECLTYEVGGAVSRLPNSLDKPLILQNNGGDDLEISRDGTFVFPTKLRDGEAYEVTVKQQPFGVRCLVDLGAGVIDGQDVTDVQVDCVNYCQVLYQVIDYPADFAAAGAPNCVTASLLGNGDGTVSDWNNDLLWTKDTWDTQGGSGYGSADQFCGSLVLAGRDDWRVPDVAQLQTLLPPGTCDTALDECWADYDPNTPGLEEGGIHRSKSLVTYETYCPPGSGCRAHSWTVGLGPGEYLDGHEFWGPDECWSGIGCRSPERVWWRENLETWPVRCVTAIRWE